MAGSDTLRKPAGQTSTDNVETEDIPKRTDLVYNVDGEFDPLHKSNKIAVVAVNHLNEFAMRELRDALLTYPERLLGFAGIYDGFARGIISTYRDDLPREGFPATVDHVFGNERFVCQPCLYGRKFSLTYDSAQAGNFQEGRVFNLRVSEAMADPQPAVQLPQSLPAVNSESPDGSLPLAPAKRVKSVHTPLAEPERPNEGKRVALSLAPDDAEPNSLGSFQVPSKKAKESQSAPPSPFQFTPSAPPESSSAAAPPSLFSFQSSQQASASVFGFGAPFGATSAVPAQEAAQATESTAAGNSANPLFQFGAKSPVSPGVGFSFGLTPAQSSPAVTPPFTFGSGPVKFGAPAQSNPVAEEDGEGEEEQGPGSPSVKAQADSTDVPLYKVRVKLYKQDAEAGGWKDLGTGNLVISRLQSQAVKLTFRTEVGKPLVSSLLYFGMPTTTVKDKVSVPLFVEKGASNGEQPSGASESEKVLFLFKTGQVALAKELSEKLAEFAPKE